MMRSFSISFSQLHLPMESAVQERWYIVAMNKSDTDVTPKGRIHETGVCVLTTAAEVRKETSAFGRIYPSITTDCASGQGTTWPQGPRCVAHFQYQSTFMEYVVVAFARSEMLYKCEVVRGLPAATADETNLDDWPLCAKGAIKR